MVDLQGALTAFFLLDADSAGIRRSLAETLFSASISLERVFSIGEPHECWKSARPFSRRVKGFIFR